MENKIKIRSPWPHICPVDPENNKIWQTCLGIGKDEEQPFWKCTTCGAEGGSQFELHPTYFDREPEL